MASIFVNTYQLYKKQTDQLAQWLLDTAERYGYSLKVQSTSSVAQKDTTLHTKANAKKTRRGKSREEAHPDHTPSPTPAYPIRLSQFTELAKVIAIRWRENSKVLGTIVALVEQIIEMRRNVSRYYTMQITCQNDNHTLQVDNLKHIHFISQLEDVLQSLKSIADDPTEAVAPPTNETRLISHAQNEVFVDDYCNRYSPLEVEEPIELHLNATDAVSVEKSKQSKLEQRPKVVYDASEAADEETDFAVFCLFEDLRRIRSHLGQVWQDYKSGQLALMTASIITNTAFGFVDDIEKEFRRSNPMLIRAQFHDNPIMPMYLATCMRVGVDYDHRDNHEDLYNYQMQEIGEFYMLPIYLLLEAFTRVLQPKHIPIAKRGYYGVYDPKSERKNMTYRQKMAEDKIILLEILPTLCILGQARHTLFALDGVSEGLGNLYRTKKIPLWLVFATQVFLDINHAMRDQIGEAYLQVKRTAIVTKINISLVMDGPLHTANWPKQNQKIAKDLWDFAQEWVMSDGMDRLAQSFYSSSVPTRDAEPYGLLKSHPLLCGTIDTSLKLLNRETGIALSRAWGSILYVGHLYNALRQLHVLDLEWPDMELFISIHTPETLFVGGLPASIEDCNKKYELMMGVSVANFAKNRKKAGNGKAVPSKLGPRNWQIDTPMIRTIKERYTTPRGSIEWSLQNVEDILKETSQQNLPQHVRNRWNRSHQLSPLQLLELLRSALTVEYKALRYDYISMHFRCLQFLRELRDLIDEDLRSQFGPEYLEREDQLSTLVGYILMDALTYERAMPAGSDIGSMIMISKASGLMRKLIASSGGMENKKLLQSRAKTY
ncbi:hypothetical protein MMC19_001326 [Ptychographa xylographoides]|nr:hypothetical protein [Ptychographa xylographoides]